MYRPEICLQLSSNHQLVEHTSRVSLAAKRADGNTSRNACSCVQQSARHTCSLLLQHRTSCGMLLHPVVSLHTRTALCA